MTGINAEHITVQVGSATILEDVSMYAAPGEVTGLIGPNGAGKSTLLAALSGDLLPSAGTVRLDGVNPAQTRPRELSRRRAVMLQDTQVAFAFLVRDVVEMGRRPWKGTERAAEDERLIDAALAATGVSALAGRDVTTLSGGERARVALSRVLVQQTPVVLLDEPTAAMDIRHQEQSLGLMRQLARAGVAVVVVLHDLNAAAAYCDRIVCLSGGRVAAAGPVAEVYTGPVLSEVYRWPIQVLTGPAGEIQVAPARGGSDSETSSEVKALIGGSRNKGTIERVTVRQG
ncbi:MAG TPA: heme ABC transporter ATP-binding protein [Corynebacterium sp.]|nr:heme ABC transporter ATP-binding protein [Corynebacterium sp.]